MQDRRRVERAIVLIVLHIDRALDTMRGHQLLDGVVEPEERAGTLVLHDPSEG